MAIPTDDEEARRFVDRALQPWRLALLLNEKGTPKACLANALSAFRGHPDWLNLLWFDTLRQRTMLQGQLPWRDYAEDRAWEPGDDGLATDWLQHNGIMLNSKATGEAIEIVAHDNLRHPVVEYLSLLKWDGTFRLDEWAITYLGCEDSPYVRAVSSRWMMSAVARIMQPGCKADCALILEGAQGIGKSKALKTLFYPWFTDEIAEFGSKDAAIQLAGAWCIELAELVGMRRGDIDRVKAFISRTHDRFRPPYGTRTVEWARQCVFAGTVNDSEYLRDETGGRRFWPLRCGLLINVDGLSDVREQLWAEARDRYEADEIWWLDGAELSAVATEQQEARRVVDPREEIVAAFIVGKASTSINEILGERFDILPGDRTQLDANRIAAALKALGWERYRQRIGARSEWRYRPLDCAHSSLTRNVSKADLVPGTDFL